MEDHVDEFTSTFPDDRKEEFQEIARMSEDLVEAVEEFVIGSSPIEKGRYEQHAAVHELLPVVQLPAIGRSRKKARSYRRIEEDDSDGEWLSGEISIPPTKKKATLFCVNVDDTSVNQEEMVQDVILGGASSSPQVVPQASYSSSSNSTGRLIIRIPARMITVGTPPPPIIADKLTIMQEEIAILKRQVEVRIKERDDGLVEIENLKRQVAVADVHIRERDDELAEAREQIETLVCRSVLREELAASLAKIEEMKKEEEETAVIYHECAAKLTEQSTSLIAAQREIETLKMGRKLGNASVEVGLNELFIQSCNQLLSLNNDLIALHGTMEECIKLKYYPLSHRNAHIRSLGKALTKIQEMKSTYEKTKCTLDEASFVITTTQPSDVGEVNTLRRQLEATHTYVAELQAELVALKKTDVHAEICQLRKQVGELQGKNDEMMQIFGILNDASNDMLEDEEDTACANASQAASDATRPISDLALGITLINENLENNAELVKLKAELTTAKSTIAELNDILLNTTRQLSAAVKTIDEKDRLRLATVQQHDAELLIVSKAIETTRANYVRAQDDLDKSKAAEKSLRTQLATAKTQLSTTKNQLATLLPELNQIKVLASELQTSSTKGNDLQRQLHTANAEIKYLKTLQSASSPSSNIPSPAPTSSAPTVSSPKATSSSLPLYKALNGKLFPKPRERSTRTAHIKILRTTLNPTELEEMGTKWLMNPSGVYVYDPNDGSGCTTLHPTFFEVPLERVQEKDSLANLSELDIEYC